MHGSYIFDPESFLWRRLDACFLTTNHRQANDRVWADILNRIRVGQQTDADIRALRERTLVNTSIAPF